MEFDISSAFMKHCSYQNKNEDLQVLPYVILLMYDSYSLVVSESKIMLAECFPNEKYDLVIEMFQEPACGIALRFINGKHSLLVGYRLFLFQILF